MKVIKTNKEIERDLFNLHRVFHSTKFVHFQIICGSYHLSFHHFRYNDSGIVRLGDHPVTRDPDLHPCFQILETKWGPSLQYAFSTGELP